MMRTAASVAGIAGLIFAAGITQIVVEAGNYLGSPFQPSSAAGMVVFTVNGALVQYPSWEPGTSVLVAGIGMILLIACALAAAITWSPKRGAVY